MAWSRITGGAQQASSSGVTTRTVSVTPGAVGRLILVAAGHATTTTTFTISDTAGNTWTILNARKTQAGSGAMQSWWAVANGTGATTITITYSVNLATFGNMLVDVFDGNDTTAPASANNSASAASGAPTGTVTPADANCLSWGASNDSITAVGSGFAKGADDTVQDWTEFKALTGGSGAPQTVNFSGSSGAWILLMAALKPAGGGTDATASPAGVSATWAVGTAVATAGATASPAGVSATWALGTAVATGAALASPDGVSATWVVGTASATGGTDATASPDGVSATWAVGTPVATGTALASPTGVSALWAVGTATATGGALTSPAGVDAVWNVGTAIATGGTTGDATAHPLGVSATWAVGDATATGAGTRRAGGWFNHEARWPRTGTARPLGVSATLSVGTVRAVGTVRQAGGRPAVGAIAHPLGVAARCAVGRARVSVSAVARARSARVGRGDAGDELALLLLLLQDDDEEAA
ncbi:MAG TPA: hypothetical protein VK631_24915 [Solirubrobacteraceae bacterium]|nr:hypothetical protein [Solirubrobacteraceae bacterium]